MAKVLGCSPENNAELRKLRARLHLGRGEIAEVALVSKSLVDSWLSSEDSANFRPMPTKSLRLLKLELGLSPPAYVKLRKQAESRAAQIRGSAG